MENSDDASQAETLSLQLSLPASIDDSLTVDGFPIIPNQGSTAEARLYYAQLQQSMRTIDKLQQEQNCWIEAIQNGEAPTDEEFELFHLKPLDELTFPQLFWKIVYNTVLRQTKAHSKIESQCQHCTCTSSSSVINGSSETQIKIQELQSTLKKLEEKYISSDTSSCVREELQGLRRYNDELRQDCEKYERSLIECECKRQDLERKVQALETDNAALRTEKDQYIARLDRSEEEFRKKDNELHDVTTKLHIQNSRSVETGFSCPTIENEDSLRPKLHSLQSEFQEKSLHYAKLELLYDERGKQMKLYQKQIEMLNEQMHVLKREFENLEKESLMERKRLQEEIVRRDEQLDMYLESKMAFDSSPSKIMRNECNNCRHLLAHIVALGKKCQDLQVKLNELDKITMQQKVDAETTVSEMRYKTTIQRLEERVLYLQNTNDILKIEKETSPYRSLDKRCTHPNIHHVFMHPSTQLSMTKVEHEYNISDDDVKAIHIEYRGPGSAQVRP